MNARSLDYAPAGGAITRLVVRGVDGLVRLLRAWRHRREVAKLLEADDRMLADIGLTRLDVEGAMSAPPTFDPSHLLIRSRAERRGSLRLRRNT